MSRVSSDHAVFGVSAFLHQVPPSANVPLTLADHSHKSISTNSLLIFAGINKQILKSTLSSRIWLCVYNQECWDSILITSSLWGVGLGGRSSSSEAVMAGLRSLFRRGQEAFIPHEMPGAWLLFLNVLLTVEFHLIERLRRWSSYELSVQATTQLPLR
jgi:hypothetical protein